jgi:hypothetical protein
MKCKLKEYEDEECLIDLNQKCIIDCKYNPLSKDQHRNKTFIVVLKNDIVDSIYLDMLMTIKEQYKEKIKVILTTAVYE